MGFWVRIAHAPSRSRVSPRPHLPHWSRASPVRSLAQSPGRTQKGWERGCCWSGPAPGTRTVSGGTGLGPASGAPHTGGAHPGLGGHLRPRPRLSTRAHRLPQERGGGAKGGNVLTGAPLHTFSPCISHRRGVLLRGHAGLLDTASLRRGLRCYRAGRGRGGCQTRCLPTGTLMPTPQRRR